MGNLCLGSSRHSLSDFSTSPIPIEPAPSGRKRKSARSQFRSDSTEITNLSACDYKNLRYVYEGRYGKVYSGTQVNGNHQVVFKFFGYSSATPVEIDIHNEIKLLYDLKGVDGIVQIQGVITDPPGGLIPGKVHKNEYPIIVTELLSGGDLSERLNRNGVISEKKICKIFRDIVLALDGLHSCRYIHR
jgi:serine/threonine protein kinase